MPTTRQFTRRQARQLVDLDKARDANIVIANQNTKSSPLLSLPAELRNRIFRNVLGGNIIHIYTRTRNGAVGLHHIICHARQASRDYEIVQYVKNPENEGDYIEDWDGRHYTCLEHDTNGECRIIEKHHGFSLGVLQTCRQLYQETALLPYAENTFVFKGRNWPRPEGLREPFNLFIESRVPAQCAAIASVHIINESERHALSRRIQDIMTLTGLRDLLIYTESQLFRPPTIEDIMKEPEYFAAKWFEAAKWQGLPLKSAELCVVPLGGLVYEGYQKFCAELEKKLLTN